MLADDMMMSAGGGYRYYRIIAQSAVAQWSIDEIKYLVNGVAYPTVAMTSDTSPSPLAATASSFSVSYNPYKAFDRAFGASNSWLSNAVSATHWIMLDFGSGVQVAADAVSITVGGGAWPQSFYVQSSNDGSTWTTRLSVASAGWSADGQEQTFTFTS